jgi:hypothetical protein
MKDFTNVRTNELIDEALSYATDNAPYESDLLAFNQEVRDLAIKKVVEFITNECSEIVRDVFRDDSFNLGAEEMHELQHRFKELQK